MDQNLENSLSQEVVRIHGAFQNATLNINKACHLLNDYTNETLQERSSADTVAVGKASAPLIVSLKQLTDNVYKADMSGPYTNTEEIIQKSLSKAEDNRHRIEDFCESTESFIQSLEYVLKHFKNQGKLDTNLSKGAFKNATLNINKACHLLNDYTNETLQERSSADTVAVGKASAPLIVSLKQLTDNVYKADMSGPYTNTEELIQKSLSKAENNRRRIEDFCESTERFLQSLEYVLNSLKTKANWIQI